MCKAQKKVSLLLSTKWYELSKRSAFLKDPRGFPILSSKQSVYLFFCPLGSQPPFVKPWKINSYMTHFSPPSSICCFIYLSSIYFAIITHLTKWYPIHQITALAASASFNIIFIFSLMGTDPRVLCTQNLFVVAKHRVSYSQQGSDEQLWK